MRIEFIVHPEELEAVSGLDAGPIDIRFHNIDLTRSNEIRCVAHGNGIAYVFDGEITERDNRYHVSGNLLVSGTLAGLGQRELALHARRLVSALAGVP